MLNIMPWPVTNCWAEHLVSPKKQKQTNDQDVWASCCEVIIFSVVGALAFNNMVDVSAQKPVKKNSNICGSTAHCVGLWLN